MGKRGRPRKSGERNAKGRLVALGKFTPPADHIVERRGLFSFVTPTKGPDGRTGEIDQDICDGIGQLHALGLLDGQSIDSLELRNVGREWRDWFVTVLRQQGFKGSSFERVDKAREREPLASDRLDRMDEALIGFERSALMSLLVDPVIGSWPMGEENSPWVSALISEGLLRRKRVVKFVRFPDMHDRALLEAALRGLVTLHCASSFGVKRAA